MLKRSWVMRLPLGLREQSAWVFVGFMCAMAGMAYLLGVAESTSITQLLGPQWLRVWGGFLFVSGSLVVGSTMASNKPLERLSLRFLSLGMFVYMGWILSAVPLRRSMLTIALLFILIVLAEIRVAMLKAVLKPLPESVQRDEGLLS